MNDNYNRFEPSYLDQEPAIILDQNQPNNQQRSDSYVEKFEYEEQQQQEQHHLDQHQHHQHHQEQQQQHQPQNTHNHQQQLPEELPKQDSESHHQVQQVQDDPQQQQLDPQQLDQEQSAQQEDQQQGPIEEEGEDMMGDSVFSNVGQGLTGNYRNMMMAYWQETINSIEHEEHDFKNHQLPLARIKKVMKTDEEVRMISAEAPILFAKGCDIFITELTMRAWIHAEENKRRTLQRSDIAAALQKSDMFDFLIDIVPREEVINGGGGGGGSSSSKKSTSRQNSNPGYSQTDLQQQLLQQQLLQQHFMKQNAASGNNGDNVGNSIGENGDNAENSDARGENYQYNDMNVYENRY